MSGRFRDVPKRAEPVIRLASGTVWGRKMRCPLARSRLPMPVDPDALLRAVRNDRDRAAFLELFEHFAPVLKGWLMRGGLNADPAEELVQEVMLRVWRRADRWDPSRGNAGTWVFAIARNARIDRHRKTRNYDWDPEDPSLVVDPSSGPLSHAAKTERAAAVREALGTLPEEQAQVIREAYFEHRSLREVADRQGVPVGTVKSRVRLAMARLRMALGEHA